MTCVWVILGQNDLSWNWGGALQFLLKVLRISRVILTSRRCVYYDVNVLHCLIHVLAISDFSDVHISLIQW